MTSDIDRLRLNVTEAEHYFNEFLHSQRPSEVKDLHDLGSLLFDATARNKSFEEGLAHIDDNITQDTFRVLKKLRQAAGAAEPHKLGTLTHEEILTLRNEAFRLHKEKLSELGEALLAAKHPEAVALHEKVESTKMAVEQALSPPPLPLAEKAPEKLPENPSIHASNETLINATEPNAGEAPQATSWLTRTFTTAEHSRGRVAVNYGVAVLGATFAGVGVYKFLHRHKEPAQEAER